MEGSFLGLRLANVLSPWSRQLQPAQRHVAYLLAAACLCCGPPLP